MSKGIRDAALNGEEDDRKSKEIYSDHWPLPKKGEYSGGGIYNEYGEREFTEYPGYKTYDRPMYIDTLLASEMRLSVAIPQNDCGKIGDPESKFYDNELMLKEAERLSLLKVEKFYPGITAGYELDFYSEERYDDIEVSITLSKL